MAIDLNNIKLTSSMTATGMYGIDMSNGNPCLSTIEHTADLYDGFTDSSSALQHVYVPSAYLQNICRRKMNLKKWERMKLWNSTMSCRV